MKFTYITLVLVLIVGSYWLLTDKEVDTTSNLSEESMTGNNDEGITKKIFDVDSFAFGYSETEIRVKKGDAVTINLTNSGGFHDWVVDEFAAATEQIAAGGNTSVTFVASETGTFEYYCSVGDHRTKGMVGKLIVE